MEIKKARRQAVPLMAAIASPSGFGKTYSALLMAAGLAGEGGTVGFVDTEMGRGSMYADDKDLLKVLPQGYDVIELTEPFSPLKYIEALRMFQKHTVVVIDSISHEWEGSGGCQDIAENNKLRGMPNWAKAKLEHKRFMNALTQAPNHVICCLRAREKTRPEKDANGKIQMVEMGMQPICEKNFMFDMTISMLLDENHKPIITKCPKPLLHLFGVEQSIISKETGRKLKEWADGGESIDKQLRALKQECRDIASLGNKKLDEYFLKLPKDKKALLAKTNKEFQDECRNIAKEADSVGQDEELRNEIMDSETK